MYNDTQAGRVPTVMERKGEGGWMREVLLGAGDVKLLFWALRLKEKSEHSHNL
jgi:hypothetical protein